jgi:hypothetical protein
MKSPDAAAFIREDIAEIETVTVAGMPEGPLPPLPAV